MRVPADGVEWVRSDAGLRDSDGLLRSIMESAPNPIAMSDREGTILFISRVAPGLRADQVIGKPAWQYLVPEDQPAAKACLEQVVATGTPGTYEATGVSGRRWIVHVGPRYDGAYISGATWIAWDVTEQRELESRLAISDRMASIGTLAAGVAHEVNNPLTYVLANLEWLERRISSSDDEATKERLSAALEGVNRIRSVVSDLSMFSHVRDRQKSLLDVHHLIDSALRMAQGELRCRARIIRNFGEIPPVLGSEARLGQVFLNLVVNAAQSIGEGDVEHNQIAITTSADADGRVMVEISDTGCGIPPNLIDKIFDPFVTTKPHGSGTGLGLHICRNVVTSHNGEIVVRSSPGAGSVFTVILPAVEPVSLDALRNALPSLRPPSTPEPLRRRRILVADDEPAIGQAIRDHLVGHEVSVVQSGRAALELLSNEDYDVAFCDLLMPDLTGMELFDELRTRRPGRERRLVFMTGGAFTERAHEFLRTVPNRVLDKPFDFTELLAVVRRLA